MNKIFKILLSLTITISIIFLAYFFLKDSISNIFNPVTIVQEIAKNEIKETDGRTNILVLGSDVRQNSNVGNNLTDTILVASIGQIDKDVVLISLPRDLWVTWTNSNGQEFSGKINSIYGSSDIEGTEMLMSKIQDVLGLEIHYYSVVTFELFEDVINTLGGVDVNVENAFVDYSYPIEGKENDPIEANRYQTISFEEGLQTMDGETALQYARSRKGNNNEGTDFARSKRQQNVIEAIKNKVFSAQTILNVNTVMGLYQDYENNVETNIDLNTIKSFYFLSREVNFENIISVVLDDRSLEEEGGLLYAPLDTEPYRNQYVLVPKTNDYSQIHAYIQKFLFANK